MPSAKPQSSGPVMTSGEPLAKPPRLEPKLKIETQIEGIDYHLVPHKEDFLHPDWFSPALGTDLLPVTVISCPPGTDCTSAYLTSVYALLSGDDVWSTAFLRNVIIFSANAPDSAAETLLTSWDIGSLKHIAAASSVPTGPYVLTLGRTWQTWRIYPDRNQTMMLTFRPGSDGTYEEYASCYATGGTSVLVPSRAYSRPSPEKPLSGLRFAVKDMWDVAGHITSCGSRAYAELRGPATATAPAIRRLVDLGAVLVGKLKLATFVIRELPYENFDFSPPWNPRGDGYLTPAESSSGNGAAIAAYPWLDMTVASDTTGSSRYPAHFDGCHGIRFSTGLMPREGMIGFYPPYDAPAMFTRDMQLLTSITRAWLSVDGTSDGPTSPTKPFTSVLVPSEYTSGLAPKPLSHVLRVADALAAVLGVQVTHMSLADRWEAEKPAGADHGPLEAWVQDVPVVPYFCHAVDEYKAFANSYKAKYGSKPFFNLELMWRWEYAARYSRADIDMLSARRMLYKSWLLESIFATTTSASSSGNLVVYPIEPGEPLYRDHIPTEKVAAPGLEGTLIAPVTGAAEVSVIPGEVEYVSRVTGNEERMPFAVSIAGPPGCDVQLLELATAAMRQAGLPSKLATGKTIYFSDAQSHS